MDNPAAALALTFSSGSRRDRRAGGVAGVPVGIALLAFILSIGSARSGMFGDFLRVVLGSFL